MTARTQITSTYIASIARDSWTTVPSALAAASTMYVQCVNAGQTVQNPQGLVIFAIIGSTATVVTLRASANGVNVAGSAQTLYQPPSNTVFTQSTEGDLLSASTTSATIFIGPFTTDRFEQPDGNIYVDFSNTTSVTVWALQMPYVTV